MENEEMSNSRENGLESMENHSNEAPATSTHDPPLPPPNFLLFTCPDEGFTTKEFAIIKLTAQFVVRFGIYFWQDLMNSSVTMNPAFQFIKPTDSRFSLFLRLVDAYERVLQPFRKLHTNQGSLKETVLDGFLKLVQGENLDVEGVEMAVIDLHAFVGGLEFFASREGGGELSPQGRISTQLQSGMLRDNFPPPAIHDIYPLFRDPPPTAERYYPLTYPQGITRKQLGIIKLTAQFTVRYSYGFWHDFMKIVANNYPQMEYEFLKSSDYFHLYHRLVFAYSRVLSFCPKQYSSCVIDGFFNLLRGEMREDGAVSDFHAFVGALDYFANRDDIKLSLHGKFLLKPRFNPPVKPPLAPQLPIPNVAVIHFKGPYTIRIYDRQITEIQVQSLSESVANFKELVAWFFQIPPNKFKLSGKTGVLEEHKSLAHYNVRTGDILTLSLWENAFHSL